MNPLQPVKVTIRRRINELFNDYERGERPALRRADALFPTDAVAWRVNGDIVTMMIGGVSGLLLQMLHPAVLAGVWDHSDFRADMHGRLRRTAKFIAVTTFDHASAGQAAIDRVRGIHRKLGEKTLRFCAKMVRSVSPHHSSRPPSSDREKPMLLSCVAMPRCANRLTRPG